MAERQSSIINPKTGKPFVVPDKTVLSSEIAGAATTGARSPISGYPANGLTPVRLANILRDADQGDPVRYLELAELTEERDPHYAAVLGVRKRSVSQLDITVEAASDDARHEAQAKAVRDWLQRDELTAELFEILDAVGKGYSYTEIIWDTSSKQYRPERLEYRDPRHFRFDRIDGVTPLMIDDSGAEVPLPPFKFISATMKAKAGLPIRSGLTRIASWSYMFKAFTNRDWQIFIQTFGQPIRVGKYPRGATEAEKDTLFNAVANIAADCAAIMPETMAIDFVSMDAVTATGQLYKDRVNGIDQQLSKAVLGQTATTDAISGGHAVGQEHREVQEDIERADAKALAAILNRDLIRPWMALEFQEAEHFPRVKIGRPEAEDTKALVDAVASLVPLGLRVKQSEMRERLNLSDPDPDDEILVAKAAPVAADPAVPVSADAADPARPAAAAELQSAQPIPDPDDIVETAATGALDEIARQIEEAVAGATSLEDLRERLKALKTEIDVTDFQRLVGLAMATSHLSGRAEVSKDA